ncbi:MAG: hypothetical protein VB858_22680 [Planctomycetaceae bacterium]
MDMFLKIVGAICLGLIGLVLLLMLFVAFSIRRKLRHPGESVTGIMDATETILQTVPPFRIKLEPANHRNWILTGQYAAICEALSERGCVRVGRFETSPSTALLEVWHLPERCLCATIYEHPSAGLWLVAGFEFTDGSRLLRSNGSRPHMVAPPWETTHFDPDTPVADLLDLILKDQPDKPTVPISAESFAHQYESRWARDMDWRIQCGGPTAEELRTTLNAGLCEESPSRDEAPPEIASAREQRMIDQLQSMWRSQINEFFDVQLRERFIIATGISALDWDRIRDQVIFIHDGLTAEDLAEHLEQYLYADLAPHAEPEYEDEEYDHIRDDVAEQLKTESPRAVFSEAVARQVTPGRHEQIGTVQKPVAADVWQAPIFEGRQVLRAGHPHPVPLDCPADMHHSADQQPPRP